MLDSVNVILLSWIAHFNFITFYLQVAKSPWTIIICCRYLWILSAYCPFLLFMISKVLICLGYWPCLNLHCSNLNPGRSIWIKGTNENVQSPLYRLVQGKANQPSRANNNHQVLWMLRERWYIFHLNSYTKDYINLGFPGPSLPSEYHPYDYKSHWHDRSIQGGERNKFALVFI